MNSLILKPFVLGYLNAFNAHDLKALALCFTEGILLRDWDQEVKGKKAVLEAKAVIFNRFPCINVTVKNLIEDEKMVVAELLVDLDPSIDEPMKVVDIIQFRDDGKILAIRAYKG